MVWVTPDYWQPLPGVDEDLAPADPGVEGHADPSARVADEPTVEGPIGCNAEAGGESNRAFCELLRGTR